MTQKVKDYLNDGASRPLEKPPQVNDSELDNNQIVNPFISQEKTANPVQVMDVAQNQPKQNPVAATSNNKPVAPPAAVNKITTLPNGQNLPSKSGYLSSYPIKNRNGVLKVTIDNKASNTDMLVFLYFKKPYIETKNIDRNELSGVAYVKAGSQFDFSNLDSGHYRVSWVNLHTARSFKTTTFQIHRDNIYAYDKLFTFNSRNFIKNDKVNEIPTAYLYTLNQ
ncbi:hypothetical protein HLH17_14400 [Acinetobacter sp. ANC 5380]|uniref:Uncharacterized protein n=1 Tax=Acinetobacter terrae TaxID=2731247 RepID=A0A7Y2RHB4_9GAMM|nr:hypothetical protein [Acinetobacter terrae]NNH78812.1 hypothetical protein [Acinetobacter terrae]